MPVIRALRLRSDAALDAVDLARNQGRFTFCSTRFIRQLFGGTGQARPLDALARARPEPRFRLGRTWRRRTWREAAAFNPYALDVASGVESAPGIKDATLQSFMDASSIKPDHAHAKSSR